MPDRREQLLRVGHLREVAVEVRRPRQPLPELAAPVPRLERFWRHAEQDLGAEVEVREHAIAIEEQVRAGLSH